MKSIISLYIILFSLNAYASPAGTKGKNGHFKVTEKSLKHLGVHFKSLSGNGPWLIPSESLVRIKLTEGVYRRFDGEITYVIVKKNLQKNNQVLITSEDIEAGDEVAISGSQFLRMAETDLNSETVDNCAH